MSGRAGQSAECQHPTQVLPDDVSRAFAKIRDKTGLFCLLLPKQKPTFHEVRSLAIKLHEDSGYDARALAGHTTRRMTQAYIKGHGIVWNYAAAADLDEAHKSS